MFVLGFMAQICSYGDPDSTTCIECGAVEYMDHVTCSVDMNRCQLQQICYKPGARV